MDYQGEGTNMFDQKIRISTFQIVGKPNYYQEKEQKRVEIHIKIGKEENAALILYNPEKEIPNLGNLMIDYKCHTYLGICTHIIGKKDHFGAHQAEINKIPSKFEQIILFYDWSYPYDSAYKTFYGKNDKIFLLGEQENQLGNAIFNEPEERKYFKMDGKVYSGNIENNNFLHQGIIDCRNTPFPFFIKYDRSGERNIKISPKVPEKVTV